MQLLTSCFRAQGTWLRKHRLAATRRLEACKSLESQAYIEYSRLQAGVRLGHVLAQSFGVVRTDVLASLY